MRIHNADHTFCYIDPNAQHIDGMSEGDGSSVSSPLFNFPSQLKDNVVYIVRRSAFGYYAKFPTNKTVSDVTSFVVIGMPKEGGLYWDSIPAEARDAWADPTIEDSQAYVVRYAINDSDAYNSLTLDACRNITMANIKFLSYVQYEWDSGYALRCSSSYGVNSYFVNCTIGPCVFTDSTARTKAIAYDIADTSMSGVHHYSGQRLIWLGDTWSNISTFRNVKIFSQGSSADPTIYCGKPKNIIIENVDIVSGPNHSQRADPHRGHNCAAIGWGYDTFQAPFVYVRNVDYKFCYHEDYGFGTWMRSALAGRVDRVDIDGVTASVANTTRTPYDGMVGINPVLSFASRNTGSVIQNVIMDFPDFHCGGYNLILFQAIHNEGSEPRHASQKQYNLIKNISISMCQNPSSKYGCHGHNDSNGNIFNSASYGAIKLVRIGEGDRQVSSDFLVQNLTLKGIRSVMLYANHAILDLTDTDIEGACSFHNCVGKINNIRSWYPGYIVRDEGCNLLYITRIECNLENTTYHYGNQNSVIVSGTSHILVHEVNGNCWPTSSWDISYPHSYICTNDGLSGNYTARTGRSTAQTWSAKNNQTDTGCSLQLTNDVGDDWGMPLRIGYDPFKGIVKSVTMGSYNATFYLAMYGYNIRFDEIKDRLFIRIKLPNGQYVYSNAGECIKDTTTVWNVEGTTNYKFVIPLDIDRDGEIEIDFTWSFFFEEAQTFLDPYPVLTSRS